MVQISYCDYLILPNSVELSDGRNCQYSTRTSSFEEGCLAWCNGWAKDTSSFLERKSLVGISMCIQDVDDIYKVVNGSKLDV